MGNENLCLKVKLLIAHSGASDALINMINTIQSNQEFVVDCVNLWETGYSFKEGDRILLAYDVEGPWIPESVISLIKHTVVQSSNQGIYQDVAMGVLTASSNALYTKTVSKLVIEQFNQVGVCFPGQPVVEATGLLENLSKWVKYFKKTESEILMFLCSRLAKDVAQWEFLSFKAPRLVVVHGSKRETSNTLAFWKCVCKSLAPEIQENYVELNLYGKPINDCIGCAFDVCTAHGKKGKCHFNDFITNEVYPVIREADIVVWLCPNYNDTLIGAQIALINRLTVLYRNMSFKEKVIYGVVVSGNSGGDSVAGQLIGSLNINKGFALPGGFVHYETANAPLSILDHDYINERAKKIAEKINNHIEID